MSDHYIKVLIVDDIPTMLKRFTQVLKSCKAVGEIHTADNGYEAISKSLAHKPDIILMDINMETATAGIDASKAILKQLPDTRIIMLTVYEENEIIYNAYQAGIIDYVLKDAPTEIIIAAVVAAYNDESPIRPRIAKKLRDEIRKKTMKERSLDLYIDVISNFTAAEIEILKLICEGKSRKEICQIRHVEASTIKTQIRSILRKLNAKDTREVIDIVKATDTMSLIIKSE